MTEREPTSRIEELEIDYHGRIQRGQRVLLVVSDTEIRQEIRFKSLRRVDPDVYAANERDFMHSKAREILWRLVAQWKAEQGRRPEAGAQRRPRQPSPS
jgi:hypothetical protein